MKDNITNIHMIIGYYRIICRLSLKTYSRFYFKRIRSREAKQ